MFFFEQADDIRTKGKDIIHPRFDALKEQLSPFRTWVSQIRAVLAEIIVKGIILTIQLAVKLKPTCVSGRRHVEEMAFGKGRRL